MRKLLTGIEVGNADRQYIIADIVIITLSQEPYIDWVCGESAYYIAHATDVGGNDYEVYWDICDDYDPEQQEEESACEWDAPKGYRTV